MGKVREKMLADLVLRCFRQGTIENYLGSAKRFVAHFMKSPDEMGEKEIREYLLYLIQEKKAGLKWREDERSSAQIPLYPHLGQTRGSHSNSLAAHTLDPCRIY